MVDTKAHEKPGKKKKKHRGYAFIVFEREKDMRGNTTSPLPAPRDSPGLDTLSTHVSLMLPIYFLFYYYLSPASRYFQYRHMTDKCALLALSNSCFRFN